MPETYHCLRINVKKRSFFTTGIKNDYSKEISKNLNENRNEITKPNTCALSVLKNDASAPAAILICAHKTFTECNCKISRLKPRYLGSIFISILSRKMNLRQRYVNFLFILLIAIHHISLSKSLLLEEGNSTGNNRTISQEKFNGNHNFSNSTGINMISGTSSIVQKDYLEKLNNIERSVAAVLIKVAYGTTSTTKRSIPDTSYSLGLTTVATPFLTTQRYHSSHQQHGVGGRPKNYELDLERDHALPTSAPNADILKSNNNPTYPNPNRHHSHDRDRHRNVVLHSSTPIPSIPNLLKKINGAQPPTIPMYPGDIPSYSPPSRAFFTPPLPPEYQNPFADKPTLRGTNNEGLIAVNRRPIPPPSLMPSQDRIPIRPPDLGSNNNDAVVNSMTDLNYAPSGMDAKHRLEENFAHGTVSDISGVERIKALNTPARASGEEYLYEKASSAKGQGSYEVDAIGPNKRQEVLPNIRRILGSKNGDIPAVLLKHVTQRPIITLRQPPSSPIVLIEKSTSNEEIIDADAPSVVSPNINHSKYHPGQLEYYENATAGTTPSAAAAIGDVSATSFSYATTNAGQPGHTGKTTDAIRELGTGVPDQNPIGAAAAATVHTTWAWAWNIHIYLSVVLFTILSVYSLYKLLTYNKLTHLFAQAYFVCINLILIMICILRIFFLCFDAYNVHGSFNLFTSELFLNLPSTFLTVAFSVLILFLFLKSLNHKNNRYSALIRPLTVVVGCGVHVVLCITLHYVESYTLKNHHLYFQQQQQQQYFRRQQLYNQQGQPTATMSPSAILPPPPRVLTLICQIIYIFICLSLGLLYLYIYRILKRILRSKSQNYIHGYQNLSYAIHITIATALLFVLLAALQIFGAIYISCRHTSIVDVDWLQWGYQFSLRLIEIAIITLMSWVAGLKTSVGHDSLSAVAGDVRMIGSGMGAYGQDGGTPNNAIREKHVGNGTGTHNSNVTNFFLPCTSSSSQEHFETDYPAVCNANTNLHTYTMRTGKLIYDDSYALNSMGPTTATTSNARPCEYQLQEPMYQRPYDTGSIGSTLNQQHQLNQMRFQEHPTYMSTDYMTDSGPDHYENPNFSLHSTATEQKRRDYDQNEVSFNSNSGALQQQVELLQNNCYSEPLEQENKRYEFNIFERPVFKEKSVHNVQSNSECIQDRQKITNGREKKFNGALDRHVFESKTHERRSSNSANSCSSSNLGGGGRFGSFNSFERGYFNGVCKSGTISSIAKAGALGRTLESPIASAETQRIVANGSQTLGIPDKDRPQYYQRASGRNSNLRSLESETELFKSMPIRENHLQQLPYGHNSEDEEDEEDDTISGNNVECTNLINNDHGFVIPVEDTAPNSISMNTKTPSLAGSAATKNSNYRAQLHMPNNGKHRSELCTTSSASVASASSNSCTTSSASDSMLVADQGFLRFRSIDDPNCVQNGSNVDSERTAVLSLRLKSCSATVNGIDC